jgi:hypothetical protein
MVLKSKYPFFFLNSGLVTELCLNYDFDCHIGSNIYRRMLSVGGGIYTIHLLSLEALLIVVNSIWAHCLIQVRIKGY